MANTWSVVVKRSAGGNWSVYFVTSEGTQHLIEGGFFSKRKAEECAEQARRDGLDAIEVP